MKLKRIQFYLYITVALVIIVFSCQKKNNNIIKHKNTKKEVEKLITIADGFYAANKFDSAFYYYNEVKLIADPKTDSRKITCALMSIAEIQQNQGDYTGSEATTTEALQYIDKIKNINFTWSIYLMLGINYSCTYNYDNSLLYYQKAYNLKTDENRKYAVKNNIALVYVEQKKYLEAIRIFESLLDKKKVQIDVNMYQKILDNLGDCYFETNNPKAIDYLNKALKIRLEQKNDFGLGASYIHLSKYYVNINPELSKSYAKLSYEKYTIVNSIDDRLNSLKYIIKSSKDKDLKESSLLYIRLSDSIFEVRQKTKNEFARIKYDSKKEKDENIKLKTNKTDNELQLERQKNRNIVSYIIIIFSICLILILYFYLTSRSNKEKIEATYQSETRISKKLHDELANDIYHTMAFAENRNLSITENKEQLLNHLDAIYSRTRDISKENSPIITTEKYLSYLKEMISGFDTSNINLLINGLDSISWNEIDKNKKIAVYRVLQELLVNMKKHSNATLVGITFKRVDRKIFINYNDNGKGINLNNVTFKNGLQNARSRIQAIKGEITFDSKPDKGFKVFFKFPV